MPDASREHYSDHGYLPSTNSSDSFRDSRDGRMGMGKKTQSCGHQYPRMILSSARPMDTPHRMMQHKRMRSPQNEALLKPEGCGPPLSKIRRGGRRAVNPPCTRGRLSGRRSGDIRALGWGTGLDMLVGALVAPCARALRIVEANPGLL